MEKKSSGYKNSGKKSGEQFFKNPTMKNKEGVGKKLNIARKQSS